MELLKGLPPEVAANLITRSGGIVETDECCEEHPRYQKLSFPDGRLVCPVCYREERDRVIAEIKSQEYFEQTAEDRQKYLYQKSIVSNQGILEKGFKAFYVYSDLERELLKQARGIVSLLAAGDPVNVYLQGTPGSGKSHLSMSMLKNANAIAAGKRCLFVNFPTLQQKIRDSYNEFPSKNTEGRFIRRMVAADILVLDDIGNEINPKSLKGQVSDFAARMLYSVMDGRSELKPTIITSNISWNDLSRLIDPRISSRMSSRLKILSFEEIADKRRNQID